MARQLESSWEEALRRQRELEDDLRRLEHAQPVELASHELEMINNGDFYLTQNSPTFEDDR